MTEKWNADDLACRLKEANGAVAVECYTDWCPACQTLRAVWEQVAAMPQMASVCFGRVNVEEEKSVGLQYHIRSVPTILLFDKGICVKRLVGAVSKVQLRKTIAAITEATSP